jgi:hypothetical protein
MTRLALYLTRKVEYYVMERNTDRIRDNYFYVIVGFHSTDSGASRSRGKKCRWTFLMLYIAFFEPLVFLKSTTCQKFWIPAGLYQK